MPNVNDMYPSKWLKATDFREGENRILTMDYLNMEEMRGKDGKLEVKPVLYFLDGKPLILNKTNAHVVGDLYGADSEEWTGRQITVCAVEAESFGELKWTIRIRSQVPRAEAPRPVAPPVGRSAPQAPNSDPFNDSGEDEGSAPATGLQIAQIKEAAIKLWGDDWRTEIGKETGGKHPSYKVAGIILDRINEAIRKRDAAPRPIVPLDDPFGDDFDDSDPFADE